VLAALRKWGFTFSFTSMEASAVRQHFKDLRLAEHLDIIKNDLASVGNGTYVKEHFREGTPLFKAWVALQVLKPDYFSRMDEAEKLDYFQKPKKFEQLLELVAGRTLLQDKAHPVVQQQLKKSFKEMELPVLTRINKVSGYPKRISNLDLRAEFSTLNLSPQSIKKVLKKHFSLDEKTGSSERYFSLECLEDDLNKYIRWDQLENYSANPFI
jgi:hypothetical protein